MDGSSRQRTSKGTAELNSTINQPDIIDIYQLLHPTREEYTEYAFFPNSHGKFTKIDHILPHKTYLHKFKTIEVIQDLLSDHSGIKLAISNRKLGEKSQITWGLNNTLLNNTWVKQEILREI